MRRFKVGAQEALAHLRDHGYVVYRDVLSGPECDRAIDLLWASASHPFAAWLRSVALIERTRLRQVVCEA